MDGVVCPRCMSEAAVSVDVADGETLTCPECEESYTVADVRELVDGWGRILPWLERHPARVLAQRVTTTADVEDQR